MGVGTGSSFLAQDHPTTPPRSNIRKVVIPKETDVIFGRGKKVSAWPGNGAFRHFVWSRRVDYQYAGRRTKKIVATRVLKDVLDLGGRFIEEGSDGLFFIVPVERSIEKASQALRERFMTEPIGYDPKVKIAKDKKQRMDSKAATATLKSVTETKAPVRETKAPVRETKASTSVTETKALLHVTEDCKNPTKTLGSDDKKLLIKIKEEKFDVYDYDASVKVTERKNVEDAYLATLRETMLASISAANSQEQVQNLPLVVGVDLQGVARTRADEELQWSSAIDPRKEGIDVSVFQQASCLNEHENASLRTVGPAVFETIDLTCEKPYCEKPYIARQEGIDASVLHQASCLNVQENASPCTVGLDPAVFETIDLTCDKPYIDFPFQDLTPIPWVPDLPSPNGCKVDNITPRKTSLPPHWTAFLRDYLPKIHPDFEDSDCRHHTRVASVSSAMQVDRWEAPTHFPWQVDDMDMVPISEWTDVMTQTIVVFNA